MKILITSKQYGTLDYTRYVTDGSLTIEDSLNVPTLVNMVLSPTDNSFIVPPRSAYVQVVSEIYASGSYTGYGVGGYGVGGYGGSGSSDAGYGFGKILASGYISNQPEVEFLGMNPKLPATGYQQVAYHVNVTSDEWLLNVHALPYIPAFIGQTQGQILASLAEIFTPGEFDVTSYVMSGDVVPYFQYTPDQTWSDIAQTFGNSSRYRYKVINKTIYFVPFGDQPLGVEYDETQPQREFYPMQLTTNVVTVPPVNDAIVIGAIEPQANWEDYFVGDGFTANFQLLHSVFDGSTALLLEDDWTETGFQTNYWFVNDPLNVFSVEGQGLAVNMASSTGALNTEYVLGLNGVELGGGLNIQHGEFLFTDVCIGGIVGGLYTGAPSGAYIGSVPTGGWPPGVYGSPGPGQQADCIAGFAVFGQTAGGTYGVFNPEVVAGYSTISFTIRGTYPQLPVVGTIFTIEGFSGGAAFLNGLNVQLVSFDGTQDSLGRTSGTLECDALLDFPTTYHQPSGPPVDGNLIVASNAVIVTASGAAGVLMQPVYDGELVGPQVRSQANHTYLLQTWVGCNRWDRYQAVYRTLAGSGEYGGNFLSASGTITFAITDFDQGVYANTPAYLQNLIVPQITYYTESDQYFPPFAVYAPINAIGLNLVIQPNGTIIAQPPEGSLFVRALTGASEVGIQYADTLVNGGINLINQPPSGNFNFLLPVLPQNLGPEYHYLMGFGQQNQTATILASGDVSTLAFYENTIPGVGARIRYQSWASGQAIARIQDPTAIANEAATSGDDGLRTAVVSNLSPLPRTSAECALAGAAMIVDTENPQLQGTYTIESVPYKFEILFNPGTSDYPTAGRFFYINSAVRGVSGGIQNFLVTTSRIQVLDLREEVLDISIDYGPDLYLEKLLSVFQARTNSTTQNLLTPQETAPPPNPIFLPQVGSTFLPNLDNAHIISIQNSSVTGNSVLVDLGSPPVTGCEVRRIDSGWGVDDNNRVGLFTTQQFTLSRVLRDQTWYLRQINGSQTSQFSKALRVAYPFIPSPPSFVSLTPAELQLGYNGYVSDIYGVEIRVPGIASGAYQVSVPFNYSLPTAGTDVIGLFSRAVAAAIESPGEVVLEPNVIALYGPEPYTLGLTTGPTGEGVVPQAQPFVRPIIPPTGPIGGGGGGNAPPPPTAPATVVPPQQGFPSGVATQFYPGDIVLLVSPDDATFNGLRVVSQAGTGALFGGNTDWGFAWYDDLQAPRTIGGSDEVVGNALLYRRGPSCPITGISTTAGVDGSGNAITTITLTSSQPVPFDVGDNVIVGIGYGSQQVINLGNSAPASGFCFGPGQAWTNPNDIGQFLPPASIFPTGGATPQNLYGCNFGFSIPNGALIGAASLTWKATLGGITLPITASLFSVNGGVVEELGSIGLSLYNGVWNYPLGPNSGKGPSGTGPIPFYFDPPLPASVFNNPNMYVLFQVPGSPSTENIAIGSVDLQLFSGASDYYGSVLVSNEVINSESTLSEQAIVTAVTPYSFSFNVLGSVASPAVTGAVSGAYVADGYAAQLPPGSEDGILFQRPVFAPSDLAFDLTQPYVQAILQIAEAVAPDNRLPGLAAYFFNLTWDYSEPLIIPNVNVPAISGLTVDPTTQQLSWSILGGQPAGHRIEMIDPVTGITQYVTTVDHPYNQQKLSVYRMDDQDFEADRIIVVTPFDEQGDGQAQTLVWYGTAVQSAGSPGIFDLIVVPVSENFIASAWDYCIGTTTNGSFIIQFPPASQNPNTAIGAKKLTSDANTITIMGTLTDTIEKASTFVITEWDESVYFISDGISNWMIAYSYGTGSGLPANPNIGDTVQYNLYGDGLWHPVAGPGLTRSVTSFINAYTTNPTMALQTIGTIYTGANGPKYTTSTYTQVYPTSVDGYGGQLTSAATASTNTVACVFYPEESNVALDALGNFLRFGMRVQLNNSSNVRYWLGITRYNTGSGGTEGESVGGTASLASDAPSRTLIAFRYSAGTDTTWKAVCKSSYAGTSTVVDTGVALSTSAPHTFEIAYNGGTIVNFYIDGVMVASIATNVPASTVYDTEEFISTDNKNTATAVGFTFYWMSCTYK